MPHDPEVEVTLVADPAVKVVGLVRYTAPQADPTTRPYAARVSLPNAPPEMRLAATVTGRVELPAQNVVALPGSALFALMAQLQSFQRLFLVFSVAPLGLIGVVAALLPSHMPLGFIAMLGVIALTEMIIRNSVNASSVSELS